MEPPLQVPGLLDEGGEADDDDNDDDDNDDGDDAGQAGRGQLLLEPRHRGPHHQGAGGDHGGRPEILNYLCQGNNMLTSIASIST